jgi:hypothetical protein
MAAGMGPVCRGHTARSDSGRLLNDAAVLMGVPPITEGGLICRRLATGYAAANVPHDVCYHSRDFEWGYGGSGPAELAYNALFAVTRDKARAMRYHQDFKWAFIANMPVEGGHVPLATIDVWLAARLR